MVTAEPRPPASLTGTKQPGPPVQGVFPVRLTLPSDWELTDDVLSEMGSLNELWRFEVDKSGCLLIMSPSFPLSGIRAGRILSQLVVWSDEHNSGIVADSSSMFRLPNDEVRVPDTAWISDEQLQSVSEDLEGAWHICPDFVVEVRSESDQLADLQIKMEMWVSQGARLAWLVDPYEDALWIYRPEQEPERLQRPESVTATEIADDLVIDFSRIWPQRDQGSETS